jgi:starch synthase
MANLRVLYIASEIAPFLSTSYVGEFIGKLAPAIQEKDAEIRILVPRFGVINERKNRLHEVVRLSGTKVMVGHGEQTLTIKVASIPGSRLQVYFLDNEAYFHKKHVFLDKEEKFYADNDERLIFFCKGALETVKNLEWTPDIIHCHDWISSLVPLYLKTTFKNDPIFKKSKILFNLYNHRFSEKFGADFPEKAKMIGIEEQLLKPLASAGFQELIEIAMGYADKVAKSENLSDDSFKDLLARLPDIPYIGVDEAGIEAYYQLYKKLAEIE